MEVIFQAKPHISLIDGGNYITIWDIPVPALPEKITVQGDELERKDELHISLVSTKRLPEMIDPARVEQLKQEIMEEFRQFIQENPLDHYELTNEFYYLEKDTRRAVVALAKVPGIEKFFARLDEKYQMTVPKQVLHVSVYTNGAAIGLPSQEELAKIGTKIELPLKVAA